MSLKTLTLSAIALLPTAALAEWNGPYVGGAIGSVSNLQYDPTNEFVTTEFDDTTSFGGFYGMHNTFNDSLVIGYELGFEFVSDASAFDGEDTVDYIIDLKLSAGLPAGDALFYGLVSLSTIGGTYLAANNISAGGIGFGAGAAYKISDQFSIGAEYMSRSGTQEFVELDVDAKADTMSIRAAYHF